MKCLITLIILSFVSTSKSEAQNWYQIAYNKLNVGETIHLYDENWKGVFKSSQNWLDNAKYYRVVTYLGENNFSQPTGIIRDYYKTGEIQSIIEGASIIAADDDNYSVFEGKVVFYYKSGVKSGEGNFKNGKRDGIWKSFDEEGNLTNEDVFKNGILEGNEENEQTAEDYSKKALEKFNEEDYYGAISELNKAIKLKPDYPNYYYNRGYVKSFLEDFNGELADYTKVIELDPNFKDAYFNRGRLKDKSKDYYGAIADFTKCIEIDPNDATCYAYRGLSKSGIGDSNGKCIDWKKAADLGDSQAKELVTNYCN